MSSCQSLLLSHRPRHHFCWAPADAKECSLNPLPEGEAVKLINKLLMKGRYPVHRLEKTVSNVVKPEIRMLFFTNVGSFTPNPHPFCLCPAPIQSNPVVHMSRKSYWNGIFKVMFLYIISSYSSWAFWDSEQFKAQRGRKVAPLCFNFTVLLSPYDSWWEKKSLSAWK